jgi:hypothetical protein
VGGELNKRGGSRFQRDDGADYEFAREFAADFAKNAPKREKVRVPLCDRGRQILTSMEIGPLDFQERTLLSRNTYYRFQKKGYTPAFETVITFCAGLDLDIRVTTELLSKSGHAFDESERDAAYMAAITAFSGKSIHVRNEFLKSLHLEGVKPLGEKDAG